MELSEAKVEDVKKEEDSKQEAAGQPAGEPEPPTEDAPDWDADEDEMEDLPQKHAAEAAQVLADQLRGGQAEELSRLLDLLSEKKQFLVTLAAQTEKDDVSHKLIGAILAGDPKNEALSIVESLRPEQLTIVRDSQGMTPLHAATRMLNVSLVHALLDKCPDMADVASRADRNPAHWTPLMTLADMGKRTHSGSGSADDRRSEIIAAALVGNMTRDGLNNRAANWATVSHLATSRGHVHILKKVLYRLNELGGYNAVQDHLNLANAHASRLILMVFVQLKLCNFIFHRLSLVCNMGCYFGHRPG